MNCAIYFYHAIFCYSVLVLYIVQCGIQLTAWFNSANVMFNSSGCNFVLYSMWEINRIYLYKIHEKRIQLLYFQVVKHAWFGYTLCKCGAQLTFGSFVLWCLVKCLVQFCNVMFNCCGCILLLYTMRGINRIWLY